MIYSTILDQYKYSYPIEISNLKFTQIPYTVIIQIICHAGRSLERIYTLDNRIEPPLRIEPELPLRIEPEPTDSIPNPKRIWTEFKIDTMGSRIRVLSDLGSDLGSDSGSVRFDSG